MSECCNPVLWPRRIRIWVASLSRKLDSHSLSTRKKIKKRKKEKLSLSSPIYFHLSPFAFSLFLVSPPTASPPCPKPSYPSPALLSQSSYLRLLLCLLGFWSITLIGKLLNPSGQSLIVGFLLISWLVLLWICEFGWVPTDPCLISCSFSLGCCLIAERFCLWALIVCCSWVLAFRLCNLYIKSWIVVEMGLCGWQ